MTRKRKVTIPAHATSAEVRALVDDGSITDVEAIAFLTARCEAAVQRGRIPRAATRRALEELGAPFTWTAETRSRKAIRAEQAAAKPAAKPARKPAAKPARKPAAKPANMDTDALIALLAERMGVDATTMAAMFTLLRK